MNPFLGSVKIRVLHKKNISNFIIPIGKNVSKIKNTYEEINDVEVDQFTKAYKFTNRKALARILKPVGLRLFFYIESELKKDYDYIELHRTIVSKDLNISNASVGLGVQDLCENGIICKKGKIEYWINPEVIFCGDRKKYFLKNAPNNIIYINDGAPTITNYQYLDNKDEIITKD